MGREYGISLWPQHTTWTEMREQALRIEQFGYHHLWIWDHFMPIIGDVQGPNLECWGVLSALGALTTKIRLGPLVCGNTYRHPAVLAKQAVALDHVTGGRAIMGLGAGWFQTEHVQYGLDYGTPGQRLAKMGEAAAILRALFDQEVSTFEGRHYQLSAARAEPKPVQRRLPLMIGGGGERKTLRHTALHADMWNGFGTPEVMAHKLQVLRAHCADVGRDIASIYPTVMTTIIIRDTPAEVEAYQQAMVQRNGLRAPRVGPGMLAGTVEEVAQGIAAYHRAGVEGVLFGAPSPFDAETVERFIGEVVPRVGSILG